MHPAPVRRPSARQRRARPRLLATLAAAILAGALLGACGSSSKSGSDTSTTTSLAPEQVQAPLAEVDAALPALADLGDKIAKEAADKDAGEKDLEALEQQWRKVEGTVKQRSPELYEAIETAQGQLRAGVEDNTPSLAQTGASDQRKHIEAFVQQFPATQS